MAALTRGLVLASLLLAVLAGLWPLQDRPALLAALLGVVAGTAGLAQWRPAAATFGVFAFAYVSYGVVRLLAGPEVAGMPFFLAAFSGLVLGTASWTRWQARRPWRVPLAWWALGVAVTWPYVAARELHFSLEPSLAAGPIITTALLQMSLALWMDRLLAEPSGTAVFHDEDLPLREWRLPLAVSAIVTAAAALYQHWVALAWLSGEPWITLQRAVGMMGDANPMGVATALWAPITAGALATSPISTVAGLVLAAPLWLAAWASGARTTLILFAAGGTAMALLISGSWGWSTRRSLVGMAAIGTAGIVTAALVAPRVESNSPVGRLLSTMGRAPVQDIAYELFWRRDGYGLSAVEAINEHPVLGVGIGRFAGLSTVYHQRLAGTPLPPDNAQNLWRHVLAEQGLVGLLPILWLTALTMRSAFSGRGEGLDVVLRVMLAGLGVSLLVGYPVQDPAIAMTLATIVCAVARRATR
jgi:hypothetical protein